MNTTWKSIINLIIVVVVSVALLFGMNMITKSVIENQEMESVKSNFKDVIKADRFEVLDTAGAKDIVAAYRALDKDGKVLGYAVTSEVSGYGGPMQVHVALSNDASTFLGLRVGTNNETQGYGSKATESAFYNQFKSLKAPASVGGYTGLDNAGSNQDTSSGTGNTKKWKDGTFRAEAADYENGYRYFVEVTIKDDKITAVNWDADKQGEKTTKKAESKAGKYIMTEKGKLWHEQAATMEKALIEVQDPDKLKIDEDTGKTDAYAGVSITVSNFADLADDALDKADADAVVTLKDGTYRASDDEYQNGYRYFVEITVKNGKITAVNWDADKQGEKTTKKAESKAGKYVMTETGKLWHEQAEIMENALIAAQNPDKLKINDDTGKTDAYAGVSITVSNFADLADDAIEKAKQVTTNKPESNPKPQAGNSIDAVSGATVSSKAVVRAANNAYSFIKNHQSTGV